MRSDVASDTMARTTIDLDPAVLGELKRRGAREGKTMGQIASELLARAVAEDADVPAPEFAWMTASLGAPLVDLEDREALRRTLDGS